ncbi:MAG: hypothetical protein ACLFN0_08315 [Thermovirgaceae bacterium]
MFNRKSWVVAFAMVLLFTGASFASLGSNIVGTYRGVFTGPEDFGVFLVTVDPDGSVTGTGRSQVHYSDLVMEGTVQPDGTAEFYTIDKAGSQIHFNGKIDFMNRLLGKWNNHDTAAWGPFNGLIAPN